MCGTNPDYHRETISLGSSEHRPEKGYGPWYSKGPEITEEDLQAHEVKPTLLDRVVFNLVEKVFIKPFCTN